MIILPRGSPSASMSKYKTGFLTGPDDSNRDEAMPTEEYLIRFFICNIVAMKFRGPTSVRTRVAFHRHISVCVGIRVTSFAVKRLLPPTEAHEKHLRDQTINTGVITHIQVEVVQIQVFCSFKKLLNIFYCFSLTYYMYIGYLLFKKATLVDDMFSQLCYLFCNSLANIAR